MPAAWAAAGMGKRRMDHLFLSFAPYRLLAWRPLEPLDNNHANTKPSPTPRPPTTTTRIASGPVTVQNRSLAFAALVFLTFKPVFKIVPSCVTRSAGGSSPTPDHQADLLGGDYRFRSWSRLLRKWLVPHWWKDIRRAGAIQQVIRPSPSLVDGPFCPPCITKAYLGRSNGRGSSWATALFGLTSQE
jgi:hypothetical protein